METPFIEYRDSLSVLQEVPFTDQGSVAEVFSGLSMWLSIRAVIDRINTNALDIKREAIQFSLDGFLRYFFCLATVLCLFRRMIVSPIAPKARTSPATGSSSSHR